MKVEALLIANKATTDRWLLTIEGGGWEYCTPRFLPGTIGGYVAGVFALSTDELGSTPEVVLELTDKAGHIEGFRASMVVNGVRPIPPQGVPCRVPFAVAFTTIARAPTVVDVRLVHDGNELATATFAVLDPVPDTPPDL
jgi:hypothetical protein